MEARIARAASLAALVVGFCLLAADPAVAAAGYRTANFTVAAPTPQLAKEIGDQAEVYRKQLAIEWLGQELPTWSKPCPISARLANGAGGKTSFVFDRGEVFGWRMEIQGSRERMLDSVLPHEITHTIFASYFRQPLPRWADEGACTTVEHHSEIAKQERNLIQYLKTGRGIPFSQLFAMKEYPQDVMPLYAQGHSLASWLIHARGRKTFLEFLADGMKDENWPRAVQAHYGFDNLLAMQTSWNDWVKQGRPQITPAAPTSTLASNISPGTSRPADSQGLVRMQSPDRVTVANTKTPTTPVKLAAAHEPVTVAQAGSSVYVVASGSTKSDSRQLPPPNAPEEVAGSVYDASRGTRTLLR